MQQHIRQARGTAKRALLAGTAFTGAFIAVIAGHPGSALAACTVTAAPNTVACATTVTIASTNVDAASPSSNDYKQQFTVGGAVTARVNAGQTVMGEGLWIAADELGAPLTFTNNGALTGSASALHLSSNGGDITYSGNGSLSGISTTGAGLFLNATGAGAITVGASGTPVAANFSGGSGLVAQSNSGAIAVFLNGGGLAATAATGTGLLLLSGGGGNVSARLISNTTITNASGAANDTAGIAALSFGGTVTIASNANIGSAGAATSFKNGIQLNGSGSGNVSLFQGGTIFATTAGVRAEHSGAGRLWVDTAAGSVITMAGGGSGIQAISTGTGAVDVTTAGTISGGVFGVQASMLNVLNASNIMVAANGNITAANTAIAAVTQGTGSVLVSIGAGATVQGAASIGVLVAGGGVNTITNNGAIAGNIGIATSLGRTAVTNTGSITGTGGIAVILLGANNLFSMSGSAATLTGQAVGSGTDTFRFAGAGGNTFDVSQIGSGWSLLDKAGSSNWTLTGTSTYAGPVTVSGGTLSVNGNLASAASLTVSSGGTLGGTGTVGTTTINAGGVLAPGNSLGTITVSGTLTLAAGSTTVIEASSAGTDRINVTGTASLAGGLRVVGLGTGFSFDTPYTILSAAGGRTGTFSSVATLSPALRATVIYTASDAILTLKPGLLRPVLPAGTGTNPGNVAGGIDRAVLGGANVSAFYPLYDRTPAGIVQGLDTLSGEAATGTQQAAFNAASLFLNLMLDPMVGSRGALASGAGPSLVQMADPPGPATPGLRVTENWSIWTKAFGQSSRMNADAAVGSARTSGGLYGVAAGADRRLSPDTLVGFALAGGGTSYGLGGRGGGTGDLFQIGLYGSTRVQDGYVSAAIAYGWNGFDIKRDVNIAGPEVYSSRVTAQTYGARLETGWRFGSAAAGLASFGWTPYAAIEAIGYSAPGYREASTPAGGAFALSFAARSTATARAELGVRLDGRARIAETTDLITYGRLAWAYQANTERSLNATFQTLADSGFTVFGARPSMHTALATLGAELRFANGLRLSSTIEGELGERHQAIRANAGLRYAW
ncbi:autotransporter outer membrane beta-barrel domain-containing protein [Phreatobacter stygius]|uniref:Autotransporter domain-containing protein n=1 Tax=Phreatobacter stygius TaxID=1940610 RepID=A0A4D7B7N3_9HYPH|nr:autotransporter outer membrane beta-barrel domain-containing protein [Phreatobacter stygius]QCI64152.1 autotransporter domain-containing protein [Phreatobacter stygius]